MVDVIAVRGAVDTHVHSSPCLYPRVGDDWTIAVACRDAGMRAIVLKSHHEATVSRAYAVNQRMLSEGYTGQFTVYGGVTLNTYVGGINPRAVEIALARGGKIVWMPSVEANYHGQIFGGLGGLTTGMQAREDEGFTGITISDGGRLIQPAVDVVRLVAEHGAILAAAHVSEDEILLLAEECAKRGATFIVNHPLYMPRTQDLNYYRKLADMGAHMELCAVFTTPSWPYGSFERHLEFIDAIGDDRCFFATDAGNVYTPMPPDALRVYLQNLNKLGLSAERIHKMAVVNAARILGIEPAA